MGRFVAMTLILTSALAAPRARGQESIPLKTVAAIKEATVYIVTAAGDDEDGPRMAGSGFLVKAEGRSGYVVTNAHVITPEKEKFKARPTTRVIFRSGTKAERKVKAEVVALAPGRDLAVLRVDDVPDLPAPVDIAKEVDLIETMPVYVFGFPFGEALAMGQKGPSVVVGRGGVSSVRRDEDDRPRRVLIDGALNPGNSGGPVVDVQGRLVGVAVETITGAHIGIAIARPELMDVLDGRPDAVNLKVRGVEGGTASLALEVALVDPLGRMKAVSLLYALGDAKVATTKAGDATVYGPLPGAKTVALTVRDRRGVGALTVPASGKDVVLTYQAAHVDGRGKTVYSKPGRYLFSPARAASAKALESWGDAVDPDGDCTIKPDGGGVVFDVPGTLHDLSAEIGKVNAPRLLREVEGDFVATVKVVGAFEPGAAGTRVQSVPFFAAGLLLWRDDGDFIRLERVAGYRNGKVFTFANFEAREGGARTAGKNNGPLKPGDAWLRLERHGKTVDASTSLDGKTWNKHKPIPVDWPARLKVGPAVVNTCLDPLTVRFEDFSIRKPGGGEPE